MKKDEWVFRIGGSMLILAFLFLSLLFTSCENEPVDEGKNPVFISVTDSVIEVKNDTALVLVTCHMQNTAMINYEEHPYPFHQDSANYFSFYYKVPVNQEVILKIMAVADDGQNAKVVEYNYSVFIQRTAIIPPPTLYVKTDKSVVSFCGDQVKFTWTANNAENGVFYNGIPYYDGGTGITLTIPATDSDTLAFAFFAKGKGGETVQTIKIPVHQSTSTERLLNHHNKEWVCYKAEYSSTIDGPRTPKTNSIGLTYKFDVCPDYVLTESLDGFVLFGNWSVDTSGNFTFGTDNYHFKLGSVTSDELVVLEIGVNLSDGTPSYSWNYFK